MNEFLGYNPQEGELPYYEFNSIDMSILFVSMLKKGMLSEFVKKFKETAEKAEEASGASKVDLFFNADEDFGATDQEQKGVLRFLKALVENHRVNKYISKVIVKSARSREDYVGIEPNVFASGVTFQSLN